MCRAVAEMSADDMRRGLIAVWHDESYFNRYRLDHMETIKALPPTYGMPEGMWWLLKKYETKIFIINKRLFFGDNNFH